MSNANEIKQHLKAVEQTRKITNAMYLLSTSQMKKAMQSIDFNLLYLERLRSTIRDILSKTKNNNLTNKFIEKRESGTPVFVVMTSDKGLCGGYNSNVINLAVEEISKYENPIVISLGIIGDRMLKSKNITPAYSWYGASQHPTLNLAGQVAAKIIETFLSNNCKETFIIYTEYVSASVQKPCIKRLLPLLRRDFNDLNISSKKNVQMIYEPSIEVVFENIVYQYITGFLYDVFMQASTSENIARMNAMQNATKNADEMIITLSKELNAARQLQITNEITEIAAATELQG